MDYQNLQAFAERSRRADEQTALIAGIPHVLERTLVYLVIAALAITLAILYLGRVQTVVETRGAIVPRGNVLTLQAKQSGAVTELSASAGDHLEAGAVVLRIDSSRQPAGQLQLDIAATQLELAQLTMALRTVENNQALASLKQEYDTTLVKVRELESKIAQAGRQAGAGEGTAGPAALTMPVTGTIAELKVRSVGDIVSAGSPVATIVPGGVPLMVETNVANKDIGLVRAGVDARIKVDAFPFQQFGTARARVTKVLPAAGANGTFVVQLDLLDQALTVDGVEHRLLPGLTVQADLVTGRQRLLDLLLHGRADGAAAK